MSARRLSSRLARIRETNKTASAAGDIARNFRQGNAGSKSASVGVDDMTDIDNDHTGQTPAQEGKSSPLVGWNRVGSNLFERRDRSSIQGFRKGFSEYLPLLFPREREALVATMSSSEMYSKLVFFDLETTGLSHGTGTVAFMAALSRITDEGLLETTQLLIDDYPGEPEFLERFSSLAGKEPILVSFNGKGFDAQILTTRYLMNGMRPAFLGGLHLDLLYPTRRLWKRELQNCRLGTIESEIFASPRIDDLPGSEAPDAWFEFLRGRRAERLLAVGEHNLEDVKTLARLLFELDRRIDAGTGRAALIRALDLRAERNYDAAERYLLPLAQANDPIAARILAIDAEHRLGKLSLALELAQSIGDERRISRLEIKLANQGDLLL